MWTIPLLAHLISNTGYNTLLRHAAFGKRIDSLFLAAVLSTAVALPAIPGIFIAKVDLSGLDTKQILLFITSLAVATVFHIANTKALEHAEASVFAFLYNLRIGIVTALSILFLAETAEPLRMIGGALVFVAGFFIIGSSGTNRAGVFWSVLAALLISSLNSIEKALITEIGWATYMFPVTLINMGILWFIVFAGKRPVSVQLFRERSTIGLLICRCISAHGFTLALALGALVSVATYVSALTCITTSVAGVIFLKEKDSLARKSIAGVIAFAGITLIYLAMR